MWGWLKLLGTARKLKAAETIGIGANGTDFDPDRPIKTPDRDRLGFSIIAEKLAASVIAATAREGLVIGIEGKWGSGKSSILNLLCSNIEARKTDATVIHFDPWIVGDRNNMATALIATLATEVLSVSRAKGKTVKNDFAAAIILSKKLRKYAATAGRGLSPIVKFATVCGLPHGVLIKKGLDATVNAISVKDKVQSVDEMKVDLVESLRDFDHRFIVVIDDIDRLEPSEAAEIIRLVRAVGDFPNIVYLLCYDKDVLARSLQTAIEVDDGKAFLQKIIQISFSVPVPEEFDLRRWLFEDCSKLYSSVMNQPMPKEVADRLSAACDTQGQLVQTPRDVGHILNALRLIYPSIADETDFADLCWLQIVRIKNEDLYKWIEEYLTVFAAIQIGGGGVDKAERKTLSVRLGKIMPDSDISLSPRSIWYLGTYIPGVVESSSNGAQVIKVLSEVSDSDMTELVEHARLGSPHHYRLYFAFSRPAGALPDATMKTIIDKANRGDNPISELEELIQIGRPQGGTLYELFLDRIRRMPSERLTIDALITILAAIGDTVDTAELKEREPGFFGRKLTGRNARQIFLNILERLSPEKRSIFLKDTFANRSSIGWLVTELIGSETFAQGRVLSATGDYGKPALSATEYEEIKQIIFARLSGPDRDKITDVPNPLAFFYRWQQAGGGDDLREWMKTYADTDQGFLNLLEKCRGWKASGTKISHPLNRSDVQNFMDFEAAIERLKSIVDNQGLSDETRSVARQLLRAVPDEKEN